MNKLYIIIIFSLLLIIISLILKINSMENLTNEISKITINDNKSSNTIEIKNLLEINTINCDNIKNLIIKNLIIKNINVNNGNTARIPIALKSSLDSLKLSEFYINAKFNDISIFSLDNNTKIKTLEFSNIKSTKKYNNEKPCLYIDHTIIDENSEIILQNINNFHICLQYIKEIKYLKISDSKHYLLSLDQNININTMEIDKFVLKDFSMIYPESIKFKYNNKEIEYKNKQDIKDMPVNKLLCNLLKVEKVINKAAVYF